MAVRMTDESRKQLDELFNCNSTADVEGGIEIYYFDSHKHTFLRCHDATVELSVSVSHSCISSRMVICAKDSSFCIITDIDYSGEFRFKAFELWVKFNLDNR